MQFAFALITHQMSDVANDLPCRAVVLTQAERFPLISPWVSGNSQT